MGRKLRVGAAMACLLVLGSVTVASATSSRDNRSSGKDDRKVVVFDLLGRQVNSTEIDHAPTDLVPDDFSQGDQLVLAVDLFQAGTKVGRGEQHLHGHPRRSARSEHRPLHRGPLSPRRAGHHAINYGPNEFPKADPYSLAIKGGMGKYRTAHGDIRIQELTTTEWQATHRRERSCTCPCQP